jgi:two-component system nitrate/nitrite response regulator NarL
MDNQSEVDHPPKKVLIIDDHTLFREGLVSIFRNNHEFTVVGDAGTVYDGIEMALSLEPDIILMDYSLPDGTGLDATQTILPELPDCKIVFLTIHGVDENIVAAIRAGAKGYLLKNIAGSDLISSLRALERGEMALSRKMMSFVLEKLVAGSSEHPVQKEDVLGRLSPREIDVLRELASGATNLEIARRLYLSENTVKHHIGSLLEKLGAGNRQQAASMARQVGLNEKSSLHKIGLSA